MQGTGFWVAPRHLLLVICSHSGSDGLGGRNCWLLAHVYSDGMGLIVHNFVLPLNVAILEEAAAKEEPLHDEADNVRE